MLDYPHANVYCIVDAGYFVGMKDFGGNTAVWSSKWSDLVDTHDVMDALNHECRGNLGEEKRWMCYLGNVALPYVGTPIFMVQASALW